MRFKHINLLLLFTFTSYLAFAQEQYFHVTNPDTAFYGLDVIHEDGIGFHLLGNAFNFSPPYSGFPIEGEFSFGNIYYFINEDGVVDYMKYLNNNAILLSLEAHGRIPGAAFLPKSDGGIILPYTKHYGIFQCEEPNTGKLTDRFGIIDIKKNNAQFEISDEIFNEFGLCEKPVLVGKYAKSDSFLLVSKDFYSRNDMKFEWYDNQSNLLLEMQKSFHAFEATSENFAVDDEGNLIFIGWDASDNYNMSLMKTNQFGDSIASVNVYSATTPFTQTAIISNYEDESLLVSAQRYNQDFSGFEYFLLCYDFNLNERWRKQFPNRIESIAPFIEDEGYLIAYTSDSFPAPFFFVGHLNNEGELLNFKSYGEENDLPRRIKIFDKNRFAIIGTKWIGYENSSIGNPFASIFMVVDSINELLLSGVGEHNLGDKLKFKVFPNPASNSLMVSFGKLTKPGTCIKLLDIYGRLQYQILVPNQSEIVLDIGNYPEGLYILELVENDKIVQQAKVAVNH
jgi:Secretion system C-terminal sorting domain